MPSRYEAAAFGRLCVETALWNEVRCLKAAAAFGRLCVETCVYILAVTFVKRSRLRAAVC